MPTSLMYRIDRSVSPTSAISAGPFIPFYTVLFAFSNDWNQNSPANTDLLKYYRKFNEIISDTSLLYKEDGTPVQDYKVNPFIYCSNSSLNWQTNTAIILAPNNDFKNYDNLLGGAEKALVDDQDTNQSGRHMYSTGLYKDAISPGRKTSDIPLILGSKPGEEVSKQRYTIHDKPHEGHNHLVLGKDISRKLDLYPYGVNLNADDPELSAEGIFNWATGGKTLVTVVPIIRDPKIDQFSRKLRYLPKNILVFGSNLANDPNISVVARDANTLIIPDGDYTRHDYNHQAGKTTEGDSASGDALDEENPNKFAGVPLYLITSGQDKGVLYNSNNQFGVTVSSNTSGLHDHKGTSTGFVSKQQDQVGDILGPSGSHNHQVSYYGKVSLKSKWLNGWVTLRDETPIANGIILAFSPKNATTFRKDTDPTDWLPPYWHFCDGTNGTPDLRGYAIAVNMYASQNAVHNTIISNGQFANLDLIEVQSSSGEIDVSINYANGHIVSKQTHSHITGQTVGEGTPIPMQGSHGEDPNRWHTHKITDASEFANTAGSNSIQLTTGTSVHYLPPRVNLAFIMYRADIP